MILSPCRFLQGLVSLNSDLAGGCPQCIVHSAQCTVKVFAFANRSKNNKLNFKINPILLEAKKKSNFNLQAKIII